MSGTGVALTLWCLTRTYAIPKKKMTVYNDLNEEPDCVAPTSWCRTPAYAITKKGATVCNEPEYHPGVQNITIGTLTLWYRCAWVNLSSLIDN